MSHYINPLHAPVPTAIHSQYTALCHANPTLQPPFPTPIPSSYKRVPQTPPSKLISAPRRSAPCVPITFDLIGAVGRGLGIPMRELVVRSGGALERMVVDATEPVGYLMAGSLGINKVSLRITWPGYDHVEWTRSIDLFTSSGPVTRAQIAFQIAHAFSEYIHAQASGHTHSTVAAWRLGNPGISFDRLVLVALWNVRDEHWMVEVYVDLR